MNKKRLLKLADLLEADANNKKGMKFDLGTVGAPVSGMTNESEVGLNCGTVGCAIGLACISGAFKRAGLGYQLGTHEIWPTFKGQMGFDLASTRVFDLTVEQSDWLFMPEGYDFKAPRGARGERLVAKRIRDFVAGKQAPGHD